MKQLLKGMLFICYLVFLNTPSFAQPLKKQTIFTHADTLRGSYGPGRDWWDALKYDLHVKFNITDSTISGYNIIQFLIDCNNIYN